jgi:hypothetical protein
MMPTNNLRMAGEMFIKRICLSETGGQVQFGASKLETRQAKRIEFSAAYELPLFMGDSH